MTMTTASPTMIRCFIRGKRMNRKRKIKFLACYGYGNFSHESLCESKKRNTRREELLTLWGEDVTQSTMTYNNKWVLLVLHVANVMAEAYQIQTRVLLLPFLFWVWEPAAKKINLMFREGKGRSPGMRCTS